MIHAFRLLILVMLLGCDERSTSPPVDELMTAPQCVAEEDSDLRITEVFLSTVSWVELYNDGEDELTLDGLMLSLATPDCGADEATGVRLDGAPLAPFEYRVVFFGDDDGDNGTGWMNTCPACVVDDALCLSGPAPLDDLNSQRTLIVSDLSGLRIAAFTYFTETALLGLPLGYISDSTRPEPTAPTPGFMNTAYLPSDTVTEAPEVVINEVQTADVDWIELYNPTLETADISGWTVRDSDDDHVMVMPSGSTLKPGAFLSISQGAGTLCEPYTFSFGLGDDDMVRLFNPRGQLVDVLAWEAGQTTEGMSVGRSPDGGDRVTSLSSTTQGAPNAAPISP